MSEQELSAFYDAQQEKLLGFILRMGVPMDEAEEVSNTCFLVVSACWQAIGDDNPRACLYRIALNEIYERLDPTRKSQGDLMRYSAAARTGDNAPEATVRETMSQALLSLTEREREAVLLRYYVHCDIAEVAMILDGIKPRSAERYALNGHARLTRVLADGDLHAGPADGSA
jgi:DNA-directed RNA polymerase specialized sigma24 family protein